MIRLRAAGVLIVLLIATGVTMGIHHFTYHATAPVYIPPSPAATVPPSPATCQQQSRNWWVATGQTDITSLAAANMAIVQVGEDGGSTSGMTHAANLLSQATTTAAADPPPACQDKLRAWPALMQALTNESTDLALDDEQDGDVAQANADLRIFEAELPSSYLAQPRQLKPYVVPQGATTSASTAGG